jgi:hypothetical protein
MKKDTDMIKCNSTEAIDANTEIYRSRGLQRLWAKQRRDYKKVNTTK